MECRSCGLGPAILQGRNNLLAFMAEAKALELLTLRDVRFFSCFFPLCSVYLSSSFLKLLPSLRFFIPPFIESNTSSIFKKIGIPVFSPTDASVSRFQFANASFCLIICSGKVFPIIALDQVWSGVGEHMQKMFQIVPFLLTEGSFCFDL